MTRIIWLAIGCIFALGAGPSNAEEQCSDALRTLKSFSIGSVSDRTLFGLSLTENKWTQLQQLFNASLLIPIGDALLPLSTQWSQVQTIKNNLELNYHFQNDYAQSNLWYSEQVAQGAYDAYKTCILSQSSGLRIILRSVQGRTIRGTWFWKTSQTDSAPRRVTLKLSSNAKAANGFLLVWPKVFVSAENDFTINRINKGNINVTVVVSASNGTLEDRALDPIPEPPKLYKAVLKTLNLPAKETDFNARYTDCANGNPCAGVVRMCFTPTNGGQIVNLVTNITEFHTTRETLGIRKVEGANGELQKGTTTVCGRVGCEGYTYTDHSAQISNCSGHGVATAQEQIVSAWEPIQQTTTQSVPTSVQTTSAPIYPSQKGLRLPSLYKPLN